MRCRTCAKRTGDANDDTHETELPMIIHAAMASLQEAHHKTPSRERPLAVYCAGIRRRFGHLRISLKTTYSRCAVTATFNIRVSLGVCRNRGQAGEPAAD